MAMVVAGRRCEIAAKVGGGGAGGAERCDFGAGCVRAEDEVELAEIGGENRGSIACYRVGVGLPLFAVHPRHTWILLAP
jgi:hypothetical protein